ncbi:MAG: Spx/MgsR family RNA polymerase-binding regulatory protein [Verrucomicrobia bacterium]|nr:Spx/MgsR family RNA polymerase-binding regulatory protein [Verrucomicrobiota bacterium]
MLKIYTYKPCSTCRNATNWLRANDVNFEELPIRETPPNMDELTTMLGACEGQMRSILNTSGQDYRALGLKDKLDAMDASAVLHLLTQNGNLIKRPFAIDADRGLFLVGFREEKWKQAFSI